MPGRGGLADDRRVSDLTDFGNAPLRLIRPQRQQKTSHPLASLSLPSTTVCPSPGKLSRRWFVLRLLISSILGSNEAVPQCFVRPRTYSLPPVHELRLFLLDPVLRPRVMRLFHTSLMALMASLRFCQDCPEIRRSRMHGRVPAPEDSFSLLQDEQDVSYRLPSFVARTCMLGSMMSGTFSMKEKVSQADLLGP